MKATTTLLSAHHYWSDKRAWGGRKRPNGAALATLRRGLGHEPGSVPTVIPYYRTLDAGGILTDRLWAEHITLCIFAVHQQSIPQLVHIPGIEFAAAMARLRSTHRVGVEGLDRRFSAAATATSRTELAGHLRSLVTRLRPLTYGGGFDYDRLYRDIRDWEHPGRTDRIRRRWGARYFATHSDDTQRADSDPNSID
ncbi:type I-E CRISPR-associated protein Cse2/CasB [Nocardia sp. NPDC049220]|uniref:type I-E CRISPR-associated protein Cse2/CasB n=1 Tax=Nocardia sp. NPDC049220 TaxID=3155273 RepID=UPI00340C70A9